MRWPKIRELKEAVTAVFSSRFTTKFPAEPCIVPEKYRGKPEFDLENCIGCGACVNVCPTEALTMVDDLNATPPVRMITQRHDTCIFCGNCHENCTTENGIRLTNEWDLAGLDRNAMQETHEHEIQMCEKCGAFVGSKRHLVWIYEKLGPLAYTNPSLILAKSGQLATSTLDSPKLDRPGDAKDADEIDADAKDSDEINADAQGTGDAEAMPSDMTKILCPKCKCKMKIKL